jgi:flagella basal body P-ring formation protein FlgA
MSLALFLAAAAPFADLDAIDRQVAMFTGAPIGAVGGATQGLDRRLRLRPCYSPVALAWRGQAHDTIVAECPDAGGWRLFVPVRAAISGPSGPAAINRGDAVTVAIAGDGFSVSQPGEALDAGGVGAWIRVRAAGRGTARSGGDAMRAQVVRPGLVTLPMP